MLKSKTSRWLAGPYLLWMAIFTVVPLFIVIWYAMTNADGQFTFDNLTQIGRYSSVFARSLILAAISTVICLVMAFPVGYFLSRLRANKQHIMLMLIMLPMWMNFLLRTYAWMSILENTGRVVALDLYMFEQVAEFLKRGIQDGLRLFPIAVNASAVLAREDAPTQEYSEILEKHNISARMLEIELTETAVVSEYDRVKRLLSSFQSDGMQTSLDDFGAGSSLLNNIVDIPVNTIKLDKLFLTRCSSNARGTDFLREVVHLVKRLGYNVICEGIETEEQVQLLRSLDCDGAQGFWFSKAIPAEEFERRYLCS